MLAHGRGAGLHRCDPLPARSGLVGTVFDGCRGVARPRLRRPTRQCRPNDGGRRRRRRAAARAAACRLGQLDAVVRGRRRRCGCRGRTAARPAVRPVLRSGLRRRVRAQSAGGDAPADMGDGGRTRRRVAAAAIIVTLIPTARHRLATTTAAIAAGSVAVGMYPVVLLVASAAVVAALAAESFATIVVAVRLRELIATLGSSLDLQQTLRSAMDDSALSVAYSLDATGGDDDALVARDGSPAPPPGPEQISSVVRGEAGALAWIRHSAARGDVARLAAALNGPARLAFEVERLQAVTAVHSRRVAESRARIVESGDLERRRLERDLHDGAQQFVLSLGMHVEVALLDVEPDRRAPPGARGQPRSSPRRTRRTALNRPWTPPVSARARWARRRAPCGGAAIGRPGHDSTAPVPPVRRRVRIGGARGGALGDRLRDGSRRRRRHRSRLVHRGGDRRHARQRGDRSFHGPRGRTRRMGAW